MSSHFSRTPDGPGQRTGLRPAAPAAAGSAAADGTRTADLPCANQAALLRMAGAFAAQVRPRRGRLFSDACSPHQHPCASAMLTTEAWQNYLALFSGSVCMVTIRTTAAPARSALDHRSRLEASSVFGALEAPADGVAVPEAFSMAAPADSADFSLALDCGLPSAVLPSEGPPDPPPADGAG